VLVWKNQVSEFITPLSAKKVQNESNFMLAGASHPLVVSLSDRAGTFFHELIPTHLALKGLKQSKILII